VTGKAGFVLALILVLGGDSRAAGPRSVGPEAVPTPGEISLEAAIAMALQGNHQLRLVAAGVEAAAAATRVSRAGRRPQVVLEELASATTNPALAFSQLLGQEAFTQADFDVDNLNNPDTLSNFTTRVSVHQPLWAGGDTKSRSEAARNEHTAAELDQDQARQEIVHLVVRSYSAVLLAQDRQQVARDALKTAEENVRMAEDLAAAGLAVSSDVLLARVRVSEVREMLVSALGRTEVARARFNLVVGRDQDSPVQLRAADMQAGPSAVAEHALGALVEQAWSQRPDLMAAGERVEASHWLTQGVKSGHRPEFGIGASAEANAENFIGADGTNWTIMATFRWALYDGGATKARLMQTRETEEATRVQEELLRQEIALQVRQAVTRLATARENQALSLEAVGMAEESLRIVADRYAEGLVPLVQLLETESALTRARFREAGARHEQFVAASYVDLAVGLKQEGRS
jgi:outer membrane protein